MAFEDEVRLMVDVPAQATGIKLEQAVAQHFSRSVREHRIAQQATNGSAGVVVVDGGGSGGSQERLLRALEATARKAFHFEGIVTHEGLQQIECISANAGNRRLE